MNIRTLRPGGLAALAAALTTTALILAGCGPQADAPGAASGKVLNLFIWEEYLDPALKAEFEKETGIKVVESNFGSNEDMLAKLQAGGGFDVVVPSDYMVRVMRRMNLLQKLDRAKLPNAGNIDPFFNTFKYDPGFHYSIPFQWSTTGIAYNTKEVKTTPDSWAYLFDPAKAAPFKGRMSMLNDPREVIGAALISLGHPLNSTDPEHLKSAERLIRAQKPLVAKYDSESFEDSLASGETVIAHGWSGEFAVASSENPDIAFVLPREGAVIFVDNLAIPAGARNVEAAHAFINFLLRPEVAARVANYSLYGSANAAALPLIDENVKKGHGFLRPEAVKLHEIEDLGDQTALYDQIWTRLKAD
jgi:spermidine/putrescine transport system substrate-binding protein